MYVHENEMNKIKAPFPPEFEGLVPYDSKHVACIPFYSTLRVVYLF